MNKKKLSKIHSKCQKNGQLCFYFFFQNLGGLGEVKGSLRGFQLGPSVRL